MFKFQFVIFQGRQFRVTDQVFFEIQRDNKHLGRIVIGLFGDLAPKAVKNFIVLSSKGIEGKSYKGTSFNRIIKRFMVQGMVMSIFCIIFVLFPRLVVQSNKETLKHYRQRWRSTTPLSSALKC